MVWPACHTLKVALVEFQYVHSDLSAAAHSVHDKLIQISPVLALAWLTEVASLVQQPGASLVISDINAFTDMLLPLAKILHTSGNFHGEKSLEDDCSMALELYGQMQHLHSSKQLTNNSVELVHA